jgi:hypothetical protein
VLRELDAIQEQTIKNAKTGEQLILRKPKRKHLLLGQCPFDVDADCWIQEMLGNVKEMEQNQQQQIALENLRLGSVPHNHKIRVVIHQFITFSAQLKTRRIKRDVDALAIFYRLGNRHSFLMKINFFQTLNFALIQ